MGEVVYKFPMKRKSKSGAAVRRRSGEGEDGGPSSKGGGKAGEGEKAKANFLASKK